MFEASAELTMLARHYLLADRAFVEQKKKKSK